MYKNPNINILLMSPGRTGSNLIVYYYSHISRVTTKVREYTENLKSLEAKEILHSHSPQDLQLINKDTFFLLSTRNLIESTFSRIIAHHTDRWRYINNKTEIKPFVCNLTEFDDFYFYYTSWYSQLKPLLPKEFFRVDYSQFQHNHLNLFDILKLSKKSYLFADKMQFPNKTPGTYKDWIINYKELEEYSKTFEINPDI